MAMHNKRPGSSLVRGVLVLRSAVSREGETHETPFLLNLLIINILLKSGETV